MVATYLAVKVDMAVADIGVVDACSLKRWSSSLASWTSSSRTSRCTTLLTRRADTDNCTLLCIEYVTDYCSENCIELNSVTYRVQQSCMDCCKVEGLMAG